MPVSIRLRCVDSTISNSKTSTPRDSEVYILLALPTKHTVSLNNASLHVQQAEYPISPSLGTHCSDTAAQAPLPLALRRVVSHQPAIINEIDVISLDDVVASLFSISDTLHCAMLHVKLPKTTTFDDIQLCGLLSCGDTSMPLSIALPSNGNVSSYSYLILGHDALMSPQDTYTSFLLGVYNTWCDRVQIFRAHDVALQYLIASSLNILQRSEALSLLSDAITKRNTVTCDMTTAACMGQIIDSLDDTTEPSSLWCQGLLWQCFLPCLDATSHELQLLRHSQESDFNVIRCTRLALQHLATFDMRLTIPTFCSILAVLPVMSRLGMVSITDKSLFEVMRYNAAIPVQLRELTERLQHLHPTRHVDLRTLVTACRERKFNDIVHDLNIVLDAVTMIRNNLNFSVLISSDDTLASGYQDAFEAAATAFGTFAHAILGIGNAVETYECVLHEVVQPLSISMRESLQTFWSFSDMTEYKNKQGSSNLLFGGQVTLWAGSGTKGGNATITSCVDAKFNFANGLCVLTSNNGTPMPQLNENVLYVIDTLNHSIRAVYSADNMVEVVAGTQSSGRLNGKMTESQFSSPQAACTYTIPTATTPTTIMVIADMNNGALRGLVLETVKEHMPLLSDDATKPLATSAKFRLGEVFTVAQPGQTNILSKPSSVAVYQQKIVVCSRGNHTLQAYSLDKKVRIPILFFFICCRATGSET